MGEPIGDLVDGVSELFGLRRDSIDDEAILLLDEPDDLDRRSLIDVDTRLEAILTHGLNDIIRIVAISLMQKLRLAWNGWQRRRQDAQQEFVARNAGWSGVRQAPSPVKAPGQTGDGQTGAPVLHIDLEGLQVAFLDDSGLIVYYLDTESGEVVEARLGETYAAPRYRAVPRRNAASDAADRREFVATLDPSPLRDALRAAKDAAEFRRVLSDDRKLERAWYVFKNERATAAIESWLEAR